MLIWYESLSYKKNNDKEKIEECLPPLIFLFDSLFISLFRYLPPGCLFIASKTITVPLYVLC